MKNRYTLTEAEYDVMLELWKFPEGIRQSELLNQINAGGKDWARQTLNTMITRMLDKGVISREKRMVRPAIDKETYCNHQIEEMLWEGYDGRLSNLVLAFSKENRLTQEDVKELEEIIKGYGAER